jgi:transposase
MTTQEELQKLRMEARKLRQDNAGIDRAWQKQKAKNKKLQEENEELRKKKEALEKKKQELENEIGKLEGIIAKLIGHRDKLAGMIFKPNLKKTTANDPNKKKRGAQLGHKGHGRKTAQRIDQEKEVHLSHCPHCQAELEGNNTFYERIVEDIQLPIKTVVTKYQIQRQWCSHCQKEVHGEPEGTLPHFRFGLNLIIWILFQKYQLRLPLSLIVASLKEQYDFKISEGGIQGILHQMNTRFGPRYQELIEEIKQSQVKHADETGWRIGGQNAWCWLFSSQKSILYTIEDTRGKAVPEKILGEKPRGVLVRDDYGGYKKLNMEQQSCWAHLLRNSREPLKKKGASEEMKKLDQILKAMFLELDASLKNDSLKKRKKLYPSYLAKLQAIIDQKYSCLEAKKIQVRISNQNANLITALLHNNVPLTNNEAERNIRKMVVTRKISGGSRSNEGARTQAVNLSIVKTLSLKKESLISSLRELLSPAGQKWVVEGGE